MLNALLVPIFRDPPGCTYIIRRFGEVMCPTIRTFTGFMWLDYSRWIQVAIAYGLSFDPDAQWTSIGYLAAFVAVFFGLHLLVSKFLTPLFQKT